MKRLPKIDNDRDGIEHENEIYEEQSEKKYRSRKKLKHNKPPRKKWRNQDEF